MCRMLMLARGYSIAGIQTPVQLFLFLSMHILVCMPGYIILITKNDKMINYSTDTNIAIAGQNLVTVKFISLDNGT